MNAAIWKTVATAIRKIDNSPIWLNKIACLSFEDMVRLPKTDNAAQGQIARPSIEEKVVADDYLDFLREQIQLNARGPEWTTILQRRLDALSPFVGRSVISVSLSQRPHYAFLYIDPNTGRLLNVETE